MDPVMLIKIPFIQYLYGIKSMRQTMKEIEVNVAYRWFLGLDMLDPVPHFSTFGKNYTRRFKDTDLFEHIFSKILEKSTDGNESRAYLCMHEFEKTGKDSGKTRLEHSQIFVDFEENKKKRSFKRKMVLGITPNTKFVYSLNAGKIIPALIVMKCIRNIKDAADTQERITGSLWSTCCSPIPEKQYPGRIPVHDR